MRTSAASRLSSPAALHASHAKQDASKTDEASPFALLMKSTAAGAKDKTASRDARKPDDSKSNANKADARKTDKPDTARQARTEKTDKTDNKSTAARTDKSDKPEETEDKPAAKADDAAAETAQTVEAQQPQVQQPAPQTMLGAAQPGAEDDQQDGTEAVGGAGAPQGSAQPALADAAAQSEKTNDDVTADAAQQAAPQQTKTDAKPDVKSDTAKPAKGQAKAQDIKSGKDADKPGATTATADTGKPVPAEPQFGANDNAAPKTAPADHTAVAAMAAPQNMSGAKAADAPALAQHIQVTTPQQQTRQPTPNMPALALQIAAKSVGGTKQFDIRLDPPELGHVQVRMSIDAAGKVSAHLSAEQPQTLELLQKDASSLTRALRDAGLDVAQDGLNFSLRQQAHENGAQGQQDGRRTRTSSLTATASLAVSSQSAPAWRGTDDGRLDIRV